MGEFFFKMPWCSCGTPMSCCRCRAPTSQEYQFSGLNMKQARKLHSLYSDFTEPETLQKFDPECKFSKKYGYYEFHIKTPFGNIQLKYKNQGNNISISDHKCEKVKEYIFPENPTPEMINLVDRHIRHEIDYPTLIKEFKSTLTCKEYNHYDLCIAKPFDEMDQFSNNLEFRIMYFEGRGWQINTGNGDGNRTMIRIHKNHVSKNLCGYWLNPHGNILEMTIDGKKII